MSHTQTKTVICPKCLTQSEIDIEIETCYDEGDDIEITIVQPGLEELCKLLPYGGKMIDEQELNKKMAEWRFPDAVSITVGAEHIFITFEHGNELLHLLTQSLDACFEWLAPEIRRRKLILELNDMGDWHWDIWNIGGKILACEDDDNPALALCLAISKLIEQDVDTINK